MDKEKAKKLIESEYINILAQQYGIEGDEEAKETLSEVVFGRNVLEKAGGSERPSAAAKPSLSAGARSAPCGGSAGV